MKNKSKLKKIKDSNNKNSKPQVKLPQGWFLMAKEETTVMDLKEYIEDAHVEVWTEAGIMEVVLGEKSSMDIESISLDFDDEYSNAYIKDNGIASLFYISFKQEDYNLAKKHLEKLSKGVNGFVCGDTEDFTPVL